MKFIALFLTALTLVSCANNSNEKVAELEAELAALEEKLNESNEMDTERYYNDELSISVISPEDWEIKENYQNIPVFFLSPLDDEGDLFQENINMVSEVAPGYSLQDYYEANLTGINQYLNDFKIIKEPVDVTINDHEFKKMVYQHSSQGYTFKVLIFFAVKNGKGYVVNCTASTDSFDDYYNDFNDFMETFKFE